MLSQAYVPLVSAAGLLVVGHCLSTLIRDPISSQWLILAALTLLTGAFTIKVPGLPVRLSVSETFVFTSVILFGACAGTLTVALEILVVIIVGTGRKARDPLRILFNLSSAALSIWLAGQAFFAATGTGPLIGEDVELRSLLLPLVILAVGYFFLNTAMVAIAVARHRRASALQIWRTNFIPLFINYLGGASLAALLVAYTRTIDFVSLGIIIPLLIISYLTFKTSLGRVDDAHKHIAEVNRLYLSTIETLASAIDAKDQVTHGHIRRVQKFTLGLASELGITDRAQLLALEAAALLHDTGKLVVPEYILNKPGKLTHGEFEKMKRHASAGADILSAVNFPYPVVPIVRHHHENWDGTGYPDGIRGTHIPIGARILSVVDCFDALTSDRPYRKALSERDAIAIILQRRGTMYDPLIVDTFISVKETLAAMFMEDPGALKPVPTAVTRAARTPHSDVPTPPDPASTPDSAIRLVLESARASLGAALIIFYVKDSHHDQLVPSIVVTRGSPPPPLTIIDVGTRISGWVAAHAQAIINADSSLDVIAASSANLAYCLSVPLQVGDRVHGVITAHSVAPYAFGERDVVLLREAARVIAENQRGGPLPSIDHSGKSNIH